MLYGHYIINIILSLVYSASADTQPVYYGEPVKLKSNHIYFTSWKYIRQGSFRWDVQFDDDEKNQTAWLKGDSSSGAEFQPVDMPFGIRLVAQQAKKVPLKPGQISAQVYHEGKYKAWYTIGPCPDPEPFSTKDQIIPGNRSHVAYAESKDGENWELPEIGIYEYAGNKKNNIVFRGDVDGSTRGYHGGSVFIDPTSEDEHYKMIYLGNITDEEWEEFERKYPGEADTMARRPDVGGYRCVSAVFGAVSPDGIHWKSLPEPLMIQHADTLNTCYYDVDRKQYVAYVRTWQVNQRVTEYGAPDSTSWITVGRRSIGRAVSDDFRHFTKAEVVFTTQADMSPSHVWYTNCKTTLPGCPDNHVMFPWLWELESDGGSVWLLSSSDGWNWSRVPGGPVVPAGNPGESDGGHVVCVGNLLEFPGNRWCLSYNGSSIPHKYPGRDINQRKGLFPGLKGVSGMAAWTKGRLVALECEEMGEFATVAFIPPGDKIRLNAVVKPTGYIKIAVRPYGSHDDLAECTFDNTDRLVGDELEMPVKWNGESIIPHEGKPIILRFKLKQCKLFCIEFY
ncbi:hypothetical protein GF312_01900 [Candidatus Poribacteria bacterium]|nr:hypothetical protein [Candidatus Poribacteria bacterium]